MKLIAGFAALVAATPAVTDCNAGNGGAAAMAMTIAEGDVQQAPDGWTLAGGVYSKTVAASTTNTAMAKDGSNNLVMTHDITSGGCKKERVDGIDVCTKIGHVITFTCSYPMKNQDIATDTDFKVSGSDTEKTATNTGSLTYKLAVDNTSFTIGSTVTATITPVTSGLVHATIESCTVKNTAESKSVTLIGDGMKRECKLGVDVTTAQGTGNLGFTWSSFKWSTELVGSAANSSPTEDQELSCNISLSKAQPTTETQSCAEAQKKWSAAESGQICTGDPYLIDVNDFGPGDKVEGCKKACQDRSCETIVLFDNYCATYGAGHCDTTVARAGANLYRLSD